MKKLIILSLISLLLLNCKKEEIKNEPIEGKFSLSKLSTLKSANNDSNNRSTNFVLDTINSSKTFYFVLSNTGQEDIKNITITTDNDNFKVSPSAISVLNGSNNNSSTNLTQAISLDIVHGLRINGVGYEKLLEKGNNTCKLLFTGQTFDGTTEKTISMVATVNVYANIMDISIFDGDSEIDLAKPNGTASIQWHGFYTMNYYNYSDSSLSIVKNSGNIPLHISLVHIVAVNSVDYKVIEQFTITPNENVKLKLPLDANNTLSFLKIDASGAICDNKRILMGSDGMGYVGLYYKVKSTPTNPGDSLLLR